MNGNAPGRRVAIIGGCRTPFCRAGTTFNRVSAVDLARHATVELLARTEIAGADVDLVVMGQVVQSPLAPNLAREVSLLPQFPRNVPGYSVNEACASANQAITDAADQIALGHADVVIAGGALTVTGDAAAPGADGVLGLIALTGDILLDVPGDLTLTNTALLAVRGGLVNLHWNTIADADADGVPDPCPNLSIDGSVWLNYRGLLGGHDANGDTISGHCATYRYPTDWAVRSPAWWPQFAEDNWLPES